MTVAGLRRDMPAREFLYWSRWHGRRAQLQELENAKLTNGGG
jgi:hypothetical protein